MAAAAELKNHGEDECPLLYQIPSDPRYQLNDSIPTAPQSSLFAQIYLQQQQQGSTKHPWQSDTYSNAYCAPSGTIVQYGNPGPLQVPRKYSRNNRACEYCRTLKARCEPEPGKPDCKRCSAAGRVCRWTDICRVRYLRTLGFVLCLRMMSLMLCRRVCTGNETADFIFSQTKTRRSDDRVVKLEQPFQSLRHGLGIKNEPTNGVNDALYRTPPNGTPRVIAHAGTAAQGSILESDSPSTNRSPHSRTFRDNVERYFPNAADAHALFFYFVRQIGPHMPVVNYSDNEDPESIRTTKPTLFLAILGVTAPERIQIQIIHDVLQMLGTRIIVNNEESLELIQALQVIMLWYWPLGGKDARWSQYCSIACAMVSRFSGLVSKSAATFQLSEAWSQVL